MKGLTRCGIVVVLAIVLVSENGCKKKPWWNNPDMTWIQTYGGDGSDVGEDILSAGDGGYFVVGTTNLRFRPAPEGDIYLVRTDSAGRLQWEKSFDAPGRQMGQSIVRANDGTLLIAGNSTSGTDGNIDVYLMGVDEDGNELWSRTVGGPLDEWVVAAYEMSGGGYLLGGNIIDPTDPIADSGAAGYSGFDGRSSIYLTRLDANGDEIWSRTHDIDANVIAASVVRMGDGGLLVAATITYFPDPDNDLIVVRFDEGGNEVWTRRWEDGNAAAADLIQSSDGNYVISGSFAQSGDTDRPRANYLFIKIDPEGKEIWNRAFGDPGWIEYGEVIVEAADGGFVASGDRKKDYYTRSEDLLLVKISANGEKLWERTFDTAVHNMHAGILRDSDGGYVVAGSTVMEDNTFDVFLVRTDSGGNPLRAE